MQELTINTLLQGGKYNVIKVLGQGGFGITYLAEQVMLRRKVAIKEFFLKGLCCRDGSHSNVTIGTEGSRETVTLFREKFLKEARNIAKLKHTNIVGIIDVFEENGTAYYVMEYVENFSLADKVKKEGYLSEAVATRYILQVANALDYIHKRNMNHLDVKPANIMLNEIDEVVLIDFGLSKQYDAITGSQTSTTPVGISHGYAPIEQYREGGVGEFSPETDIYAIGATFFNLLTGMTPPSASDILEEGVPVNELKKKDVSQKVLDVICKAMEGRKKDRFHDVNTIKELLSDISPASDDDTDLKDKGKTTLRNNPQGNSDENNDETVLLDSDDKLRSSVLTIINDYHDGYLFYLKLKEIPRFVKNSRRENCQKILSYKERIIAKQKDIDELRIAEGQRLEEERKVKQRKTIIASIAVLAIAVGIWFGFSHLKNTNKDSDVAELEVEIAPDTLEDNNHECIDLGLSVKWAICNLGAKSQEDVGGYYAWGESCTKDYYGNEGYFDTSFSLYCPGGKTILESNSENDAAHVLWGGSWRIPSRSEFQELIDSCKWYKETINKVQGYRVEGKNGHSIFLPLSGMKCGTDLILGSFANYWINELLDEDGAKQAFCLGHEDKYDVAIVVSHRANGLMIRPVSSK